MREVAIKTNQLSKKYKSFVALDNANITVYKDDIYGIVGRNGAGKTTLMKIITGLTNKTSGEYEIFSKKDTELSNQRRRIGCLIENPAFFGNMSAHDNLKYYCTQKGITNKNKIDEVLEIVNLTKKYGANVAVNNLTVSLPKGKIIGLLGPNGSGKTTLIKMLNGLLTPTEGTIMIDGNYVGPATKSKVAYLPDRTYLTMNQTIREILDFFQDFYTDFSRERAEEMLKSLGIDPAVKMRTLSKGTKEKVQLILVMSRNASLYILDEPIAGVDPAARDYILRTIINNYNPEATVLISTHLIEDVEQVLDEVIFMRYGQLVLYTSVDNIREEKGKSVDAYFREVFAC